MSYSRPDRLRIITNVLARSAPAFRGDKIVRPKNFDEILALEGITRATYNKWISEDVAFANMEKEVRDAQASIMGKAAMRIIENALTGGMKLKDDKLVDVALRYAEKTQPEWKESIDLNLRQDFGTSTSDLEARAMELLNIIKKKDNDEQSNDVGS